MIIIRGLLTLISVSLLVSCVSLDYVFPKDEKVVSQDSSGNRLTNSGVGSVADAFADADGDGIPDWVDLCDETATDIYVDTTGCELVTGIVVGLKFAPDEVALTSNAKGILDRNIAAYKLYPDTYLAVEGHTDNRGSAADNLELSKLRVKAVVAYLVDKGIGADRLKPFAFGENRPIASNATLAGRERNRRIEINFIERLL